MERGIMASLDIQKYTKQQAGGLAVHLDNEHRKASKTHANKHIDTSLSDLNYYIGCEDYYDMYKRANKRLEESDKIKPPQKKVPNRKTHLMIEIKCPKDLEQAGRSEEFFDKTYHWLVGYLGDENVHGAVVHCDEVHDYYDPVKKCMVESLEHMHVMASPHTEEKGINCKAFMNKWFLINIQKDFNQWFLQEYGFEYQTHGRARHQKTEDMKRVSDALETEIWEKETVSYQLHKEDEILALTDKAESLKNDVKDLEVTKSALEEENAEIEAKNAKLHEEVREYSRDYITAKTNVEKQLDKKREELKELQTDIAGAKNEELDLSLMLEEAKRKLKQLQKDYDKVQADYESAQAKTKALEDDYNHKYDDMKQLVKTFNEAIKYGEEDLAQLKLDQMHDYEDDLSR